jgi:DNA-binding response OmpR family regulator
LARRGVQTFSASRVRHGLQMARRFRPDVIVLDLETDESRPAQAAPVAQQWLASRVPLVLLGSLRRGAQAPGCGEFVPKPYHYGPLIRRIEGLLYGTQPAVARSA